MVVLSVLATNRTSIPVHSMILTQELQHCSRLACAGASEQALAAAVQAVQLAPSWPAGHLTLAAAARNCGLLEPAAAALRTALQLLPVQAQQRDEAEPAQQQRDEAVRELHEVLLLQEQQLARDVGLPALRIMQQAGLELEGQHGEGGDVASASGCTLKKGSQGPSVKVWEAGIVLARLLVEDDVLRQRLQAGGTVLELGAGAGVVGLAAALMGARAALTDLPRALPALRRNADRNGAAIAAAGGRVHLAALDWSGGGASAVAVASTALRRLVTSPQAPQPSAHGASHPQVTAGLAGHGAAAIGADDATASLAEDVEQRSSPGDNCCSAFDLILGADLVYASHQAQPVAEVLSALAAAHPGATLLLAHKHRTHTVDAALAQALEAAGLQAALRLAGPRACLEQTGLACRGTSAVSALGTARQGGLQAVPCLNSLSELQASHGSGANGAGMLHACLHPTSAALDPDPKASAAQTIQKHTTALVEPLHSPLVPVLLSPAGTGDVADEVGSLPSAMQQLLNRYPTVCVLEVRMAA